MVRGSFYDTSLAARQIIGLFEHVILSPSGPTSGLCSLASVTRVQFLVRELTKPYRILNSRGLNFRASPKLDKMRRSCPVLNLSRIKYSDQVMCCGYPRQEASEKAIDILIFYLIQRFLLVFSIYHMEEVSSVSSIYHLKVKQSFTFTFTRQPYFIQLRVKGIAQRPYSSIF